MRLVLVMSCLIGVIHGSAVEYMHLSKYSWVAVNSNQSIKVLAEVPGGIYSDLMNARILKEDIYYGYNDRNYRWVGYDNWTYYTAFKVDERVFSYKNVYLVFEGVDTIANIKLNNKRIGTTDNMFVMYKFDVRRSLKVGINRLEVEILSPVLQAKRIAEELSYRVPSECWPSSYNGECHINKLRKMQASFAWDWGPAFPSMGIWRPVRIEMSDGVVLRSVGVTTTPLRESWRLNLTAWFDPKTLFDGENQGVLTVLLFLKGAGETIELSNPVRLTEANGFLYTSLALIVPKTLVKEWWPNGYGEPKLYKMTVIFSNFETTTNKTVWFGFRDIKLVQDPIANETALTFHFKVNNVSIFAKGSNWIPSHVLPEKTMDEGRIRRLLKDSAAAHFNMLRVWGGGLYESDYFYKTCDELGILVWQDLLFACNMYPTSTAFLESVRQEIRQQVTRLQHHPSIALWAGNNENEVALRGNWYGTSDNFELYKNDYITLYVSTIKPIVQFIDTSRSYIESSPTNGIVSEEEGYVARNPYDERYGDTHYYNYLSNGWNWMIYPKPKFASEYGVQSLPDVQTLREVAPKNELTSDSKWIHWREHHPGGIAILNFSCTKNLPQPNNSIESLIYLSQINQAMTMKVETESYRQNMGVVYSGGLGDTMGALYWQLNDIWQAPSWSSIDYRGRWKMLHYYAKNFFAPIVTIPVVSADDRLWVSVVSDQPTPVPDALLKIRVVPYRPGVRNNFTFNITVKPRAAVKVVSLDVKQLLRSCGSKESCFFELSLEALNGTKIAPDNFLFLETLKNTDFLPSKVKVISVKRISREKVEVSLFSDTVALFVWLQANNCEGVFSENGFHITNYYKTIEFTSNEEFPLVEDFLGNLTITSLQPLY